MKSNKKRNPLIRKVLDQFIKLKQAESILLEENDLKEYYRHAPKGARFSGHMAARLVGKAFIKKSGNNYLIIKK